MTRIRPWNTLFALLGLLAVVRGVDAEDAAGVPEPPPGEFLVLPLKVHLLTATDLPEVNCGLGDNDVRRVVGKVNGIWHRAGIHWGLVGAVREPAARQRRYRLARDLNGPDDLAIYRLLIPEVGRGEGALHVYFLHRFPVNGVWMGEDFVVVQETAELRKVEGGIDEPLPRVTAHELGHALGLPHRQDRTNLLASGTTGTSLNAEEIETVRKAARRIKGVRTVENLRAEAAEAEKSGDRAGARKLWTWLREIPGLGDEAGVELERLKSETGRGGG